jgi:hypothetical protein
MHRWMDPDPGGALEELRAEAALAPEWQTQDVAIEFDRPIDIGHEDGGTVQGDFHGAE